MPPMRIAVVGDCNLDVSVRPSAAVSPGADVPADVELLPGGQGANVAVRLARRGRRVRLIAPLAADAAGRVLLDALRVEGVHVASLPADRTGIVVAQLDASGERALLSHRVPFPRGVTARHELIRQLRDATWVHVSGYALLDPVGGEAVAAAVGSLPPGVVRSADTDSLSGDGETSHLFGERLGASGVVVLFAGRREADALLRPGQGASADPLTAQAAELARSLGMGAIVTGGVDGSAACLPPVEIAVPAYAPDAPAVDTTGAGDAYAAAVIGELASAPWPPSPDVLRRAMQSGSEVGSRVARARGAQALVLGEFRAGRAESG